MTQLGCHLVSPDRAATTYTRGPLHLSGLSPEICAHEPLHISYERAYISPQRKPLAALQMLILPMSLSSPPSRHSMDSNSDGSSNSPDTLPDSRCESTHPPQQPRKPIPRKGHTKSRRGCYNCKRRRIKCNERHPQCNHCIKAGLRCEYPANIIQTTQRSPTSPSPQALVNLRSTPGTFVSGPRHESASAVPDFYRPCQTCDYSTIS